MVGLLTLAAAMVGLLAGTWILRSEFWGGWGASASWGWSGVVAAMRLGLMVYMGFLVILALYGEIVPKEKLPLVLLFAGVGFSSAGSISGGRSLKACASFAGMVVSLVGSYMQVQQELVDAWHLMVAVGLVSLGLFIGLSYDTHPVVVIFGRVLLAFLILLLVLFLGAILLVIVVASRCSLG